MLPSERNDRPIPSCSKYLFALSIFLSAFLLFQVQPLVGKFILPWFGGAPAVWTACMLFFQLMLLAGYCYAHWSVRCLSRRTQGLLHIVLLVTTIFLLPIIPESAWKPTTADNPTFRILALLTATVGGPYFLLAATAPLLQSWFHHAHRSSPFRLYALSNAGSLLALFTYPFVVERMLRSTTQAWTWSLGYVAFALTCGWCALRFQTDNESEQTDNTMSNGVRAPDHGDRAGPGRLQPAHLFFWLCLSACGSLMLLATTNELCQDVAVVPFLWVLPLTIYLLSFVICFDNQRWYHRDLFGVGLIASVFLAILAQCTKASSMPLTAQVAIHAFVLFCCCMICHGELVRLKPDPRHLTTFYLMVSLGGAIGGLFVAVIAPLIFDRFHEYGGGIIVTCILAVTTRRFEESANSKSDHQWRATLAPAAMITASAVALGIALRMTILPDNHLLESRRNFYGALRVTRQHMADPHRARRTLTHGITRHGLQYEAAERRRTPTLYYRQESGVAFAIEQHPLRTSGKAIRVGVVGLGCGTLSCYMNRGDYLRYYEIDPAVVEMAAKHFTFNRDAIDRGVDVDVLLGDARLVLERQIDAGDGQHFDVLVVDAFSSDAVPIHLLTEECFQVYWRHLKPDGILAVHISNRHLNLAPVIRTQARAIQKTAHLFRTRAADSTNQADMDHPCDWVLVTDSAEFIERRTQFSAFVPWPKAPLIPNRWTDDFSNLFSVLR